MQISNFHIQNFTKPNFQKTNKNILKTQLNKTNPIIFKGTLEEDCVELEAPKKAPTRQEIIQKEIEKRINNRPHLPSEKNLKNEYRKSAIESSGLGFTKQDLENQDDITKQIIALEPNHKIRIGSTTYFALTPVAKDFIQSKLENGKEILDCTYLRNNFGLENNELEALLNSLGIEQKPYPKGTFQDANLEKYYVEFDSDLAKEVFEDLKNKKVLPRSKAIKGAKINFMPLYFKKYQKEGETVLAMPLVDLENEENRKVIDGSNEYREFLAGLGFKTKTQKIDDLIIRYVDMEDKDNQAILKSTTNGLPQKHPIYFADPRVIRLVPADFLASQGSGSEEELKELVLKGKLKGEIKKIEKAGEEDGKEEVLVEINPENYQVLTQLRRDNLDISSPSICAKALGISVERLRESIYYGDFDVIPECYTPYGLIAHFINIATPKNKSFIQRTQFEQTFVTQRLLTSREQLRQKEKFKKLILESKLHFIRGAISYAISPNTRMAFEKLVQEDRTFRNLLIKQEEEKEPLTLQEKAYLRETKKAFWEKNGTEEIEDGYEKALLYVKLFKEGGLENVPDAIKPIFKLYNIKKHT